MRFSSTKTYGRRRSQHESDLGYGGPHQHLIDNNRYQYQYKFIDIAFSVIDIAHSFIGLSFIDIGKLCFNTGSLFIDIGKSFIHINKSLSFIDKNQWFLAIDIPLSDIDKYISDIDKYFLISITHLSDLMGMTALAMVLGERGWEKMPTFTMGYVERLSIHLLV